MLDIKYIRENLEKVKQAAKNKNRAVDFDRLLALDDERRKLTTESEGIRAERNILAKKYNNVKPAAAKAMAGEGKELKEKTKKLEEELKEVEEELKKLMYTVPNVPDESVPVGKDAEGNKELRKWGDEYNFSAKGGPASGWDFKPLDHIELGLKNDFFFF